MAHILRESAKAHHFLFVELGDPRTHNFFLMSSPIPAILILAGYLYFVKRAGPRWMKDRPPVNIDRLVQVYNVIQIVVNMWIFYVGWILCGWHKYNQLCEPVDYSTNPEPIQIAEMAHCYLLLKLSDLLDTVFMILRKKNSQASFLHIYHHAMMVFASWMATKYFPGGQSVFLGHINSLVHVVMYSYYLVTSLYPQYKNNIWWKKYITQMQMVQFFLIFLHHIVSLVNPSCDYPKWVDFLLASQAAFMASMFYDFYRKAYKGTTPTVAPPSGKKAD